MDGTFSADKLVQRLIAEYGALVWAHLARIEQDDHLRDEIWSDVFYLAYQSAGDLKGLSPSQQRSWLMRTSTNLTANAGRRERTNRKLIRRLALEHFEVTSSAEEAFFETISGVWDGLDLARIRTAWHALGDGYRQVLILDALGYNGPMIAKRLGITHQAARSRLMRARSAFFNKYRTS